MNTKEIIIKLQERLIQKGLIPIGISARHVHLTREAVAQLFGSNYELTVVKELSQPGYFMYKERVHLKSPKGELKNIAILGPCRESTQVELSYSDARQLKMDVPVRLSGNISGTPALTIYTDYGSINITEGVIIAKKHIHMTEDYARTFGLKSDDIVNVKVLSDRPITFEDVALRIGKDFVLEMHIDVDEANCGGLGHSLDFGIMIPHPDK